MYTSEDKKSHYTTAAEIVSAMIELLGAVDGKVVLEPAAGDGAFIDALRETPKRIDAVDIDADALGKIAAKKRNFVKTRNADFIDAVVSNRLAELSIAEDRYDAVISNPPYGLSFSIDYREKIKKRFPNVYARESYGLFLTFSIMQLKEGGRYVFLIPDTFLHSFYHRPLRRFLIEHGRPTHIIQFNSSRFQTVNYGYGGMCIIAGVADALRNDSQVEWFDYSESDSRLRIDDEDRRQVVIGENLIGAVENGWALGALDDYESIVCSGVSLGDLAECKTGIYTGNNEVYCGYDETLTSIRGKGHPINWSASVRNEVLTPVEQTFGISAGKTYVPLIRGGHRKPFEITRWAINWSVEAVKFYKTDKKARLQNADFYFKKGIAVPMVTSGRISASVFDGAVFDQGVVGVFPKRADDFDFLLLYLNSRAASLQMRKINNGSANNSANYIKKITIPEIGDGDRGWAASLLEQARHHGWGSIESAIDDFFGVPN